MTDRPDQNPVSSNIVRRLLLIDRADERVDSFQKRPTKTPLHFCFSFFAPRFFPTIRAARVSEHFREFDECSYVGSAVCLRRSAALVA